MDNKSIIHGEIVPVITLTRRQIEEDWYTLHQQLARKTQECENWKETANQYAKNEEYYRSQVDQRKAENEKAEQKLEQLKLELKEIFRCLIKENRKGTIKDTMWLNNYITLWDYIAQILDIQGDQNEVENQIIQKCEEVPEL